MLRDVTLGRYYETSSFLHSLDPRTKLVALPVLIAGIFLSSSVCSCILTLFCIAALIAVSRVPLRYMLRGMTTVFVFILIVFVLNAVLIPDGLWRAVLISIRVIEVVLVSNLLSLTTRPRAVSNGLEKGLGWMNRFKVPVHDLAMIVSIAFRFVPLLADEAKRIMDAQISRGADYRNGTLVRKARASVSVIIPVFVSAMERSEELAVAMDSRLYGSGVPTHFHVLSYTYRDAAAYICIFTYLCVCILMKAGGL
ncbi:MAG: energy-coupling factor transporter transmembrane protein EcfT [Spirochaetales bacterium]|nr:energy-coupling factor transporter transmembrane protein EcfT [Spirochaetales bacterium]